MIHLHFFTFNPLQENTYILWDETKEAVIIDPGCYDREEREVLSAFIKEKDLAIKKLINTHCHIDHVLGNYYVKEKYKVNLEIPRMEEPVLKAVSVYAPSYGIMNYEEAIPDKFLEEGVDVKFGHSALQVLFVPGHSPGHLAFYNNDQKFCIGGDVLFYRSIGRPDLPGGNLDVLLKSIREKIFTLGDNVRVYPGHGTSTIVGEEKLYNPYLS